MRSATAEDVAVMLAYAQKVVIVPGYGMAVAQAQHDVRELADVLEKKGIDVDYAIHPVAGRMPGHMNVLLAEANVPYTALKEMDEINPQFAQTDVALVIGANDVVNPARDERARQPDLRHADPERRPGEAGRRAEAVDEPRASPGIDNPLFVEPKTVMLFGDAKESVLKLVAVRQGALTGVPVFTAQHVEQAVSPERAVEAVRDAFVAYARGEWTMPPKVYVTNYPAGDFRAMPALGGGHALLKWVTSFPGNPQRGAADGQRRRADLRCRRRAAQAVMDAGAVTALRTGAAAVLAAETLGRAGAATAAVIGAGVNGRAVARTFLARGPARGDLGRRRGARAPRRRRARRRRGRVARGRARRRPARHRDAGPRDRARRGQPPAGPARQPDGRRRPGQGRDRVG